MTKEVGRFDREDGQTEPMLDGGYRWVLVNDTEGMMYPREDGFGFYPVDPADEDHMLDKDYGPTTNDAIPQDGIPLDVVDDMDDDGLIWERARYYPNRSG